MLEFFYPTLESLGNKEEDLCKIRICTQVMLNGEIADLTDEMKQRILAENTESASLEQRL